MRSLMLVSAFADASLRDAVDRGTRPRPEFLELEETHGVDLLDWSRLTPRPRRRSIGTSLTHVRAALGRVRDYDVVLSDGEHVGIPLALALAQLRIDVRHVVIGHHLDTEAKRRVFRTLRPGRGIDAILVHSRNQLPLLHRTLSVPASSLHVVPYGVDTSFWAPVGAPEEDDLVVSVGREHRDYETLLAALPSTSRLIIADGSPFSPNANRRDPEQWPAHVVRRAFDPVALRDLYDRAAVVVVPVIETTFPAGITTLVEAMSMGKAVIVTGTSGLAGVVSHDAAVVVPPGDHIALTRALRELLADPQRRRALGERAREFANRMHSLDVYGKHLVGQLASPRTRRRSVTATL
jgi:glycosyltransferase involved in cell wall biosynthesis